MKKLLLLVMLFSAIFLIGNTASAYNILQLDIYGGNYQNGDTVSADPTPKLVAMLNPDSGLYGTVDVDSTFFITAALVPMDSSYSGSNYVDLISYDGASNVSGPVIKVGTPYSLQTHSIFPTTYWEWSFKFDGSAGITPYNVADLPDVDPTYNNPPNAGDFYGAIFDLDVSDLLAEGYYVHYDLFGFDDAGGIVKAPFSHDATSAPEPATMLLLGSGLLGFGVFGRKKFKK